MYGLQYSHVEQLLNMEKKMKSYPRVRCRLGTDIVVYVLEVGLIWMILHIVDYRSRVIYFHLL